MIETRIHLSHWFRELVEDSVRRRGLAVGEPTRAYVIELLTSFGVGRRRAPGAVPLALQLKDAVESASSTTRLALYRTLGDEALCLSGFFSDHLERRGLSETYVKTMGEGAYSSAHALAARAPDGLGASAVYRELAASFDAFARVLDDVRESTSLRTPQDIVKLYDKWRRTGSPKAAERLTHAGLYPVAGARRQTH